MTRRFIAAIIVTLALAGLAYGAESGKVLARVNSEDITEAEVMEFIKPYGQQAMMLYNTPQGKKMILDDVISMRLYALDAEANKLDETAEFQEQLAAVRRALLAQASMRKLVEGLTVSDDEAKKFYDDNQQMFKLPERVRASHILVSDDVNLAKVVYELKSGESFDAVAKKYSIDPGSAANGGDLGEFQRGMMVKEFEEAAFALKNAGDISEPVKTQFGWHIIKLGAHIAESTAPFEQVKARIVQQLREQKTQQALIDKAKALEGVFKVERFE